MVKDFKRGGWTKDTIYELRFFVDSSGGYAFQCDKDGNPDPTLGEQAKENLAWALEHPEKFPYCFNEVAKQELHYKEPNTGTCSCGEHLNLTSDYMGACQCPKCGQWYNTAGQELLPPEQWGWDGTPLDAD